MEKRNRIEQIEILCTGQVQVCHAQELVEVENGQEKVTRLGLHRGVLEPSDPQVKVILGEFFDQAVSVDAMRRAADSQIAAISAAADKAIADLDARLKAAEADNALLRRQLKNISEAA